VHEAVSRSYPNDGPDTACAKVRVDRRLTAQDRFAAIETTGHVHREAHKEHAQRAPQTRAATGPARLRTQDAEALDLLRQEAHGGLAVESLRQLQRDAGNEAVAGLIRGPGPGLLSVQRDGHTGASAEPKTASTVTGKTDPVMAMVNTSKLYARILREQKYGLTPDFEKAAKETPKPSMAAEILKAVALVALAAVTDGIGEAVAAYVMEEGADIAAKAMTEMLKTTVAEGLKTGVEKAAEGATEKDDPIDAFIDWQTKGLDKAADDLEDRWDLAKSSEFLAEYRGDTQRAIKDLNAWRTGLDNQKQHARRRQFEESILQWANYLTRHSIKKTFEPSAKALALKEKPATDLGSVNQFQQFLTPGVLTLDAADPKSPTSALPITDARIHGLSERLRKELQDMPTPIAQLGIPYVVQFVFWDDFGYHAAYLSRNEGGSVFIKGESQYDLPRLMGWLHSRLHPYPEIGPAGESGHAEEAAYTAARLILEDAVGKNSIKQLGLELRQD
jgi:hypothetical protein